MATVIEDNWEYTISNGYATVNGYYGSGSAVVIPSSLGGYPVTALGEFIFHNKAQQQPTSITIPSSVKIIGRSFAHCTALTSIVIPDSVITVGNEAFSQCDSLVSVTFGSGVTTIGATVFALDQAIREITFRGLQPTTIGNNAFYFGNASATIVSVKSPGNWAASVLNNYKDSKTTFTYAAYDPSPGSIKEYMLLKYNGSYPIQVDSAVRDGTGARIDTHYVVHAEYTETVSTSQEYLKYFSDSALASLGGRTPRLVQVYDASGKEILTDVTIDLTTNCIKIYPTAISPAQTWTVRVTAW